MKLRMVCVMVGFLSLALSLAAQTASDGSTSFQVPPPLIQFSNVATDGGGSSLSGVVNITFSLYNSQQGGEPLWTETQNDVQLDSTGHYSVQLGITKPNGVPTTLFTTGEARWLGVQIAEQTEQPRILLLSVPYALKAGDAATIGGLPPSAFVLAAPQTGVASAFATASATRQSVSPATTTDVTTTGGTVRSLPVFSGTSTVVSSAVSQLGSGSTTTVEVKGSGAFTADTRVDYSGLNTGSYTPAIRFGTGNTGEAISSDRAGTVNVNGIDFYTDFMPRLSITNAGNVGIGTTTPAYALDVQSSATYAVYGQTTSFSSGSAGVYGAADQGANAFPSYGVAGNTLNYEAGSAGVYGSGVVGVYGISTGFSSNGSASGGSFAGFSAPAGSGMPGSDGVDVVGGAGDTTHEENQYGGNGVSATGGAGAVGGTGVIGSGGKAAFSVAGVYGDGPGGTFHGANSGGSCGEACAGDGDGMDAYAGSGLAGYFSGNVEITGTLNGSVPAVKMDHPLDPADKYLLHASVESSEMMNIYTGNVTTDSQGHATVQLPKWFEVLNTDFRYQLTVIGQFAQAIIGRKIDHNQFEIRTSAPNVEVSWQVTSIRQDAYAKAHPLVVEQEKEVRLRGFYIHPELYGAPPEKQIEWARHPQTMKRIKEMQAQQLAAAQKQAVPRN